MSPEVHKTTTKIQILCDPQFQGFPTIHYIEFLSDVILYIYVVVV